MAIELVGVSRHFGAPGRRLVQALDSLDLTMGAGSAVALMGPSGSGKSTLLHLIGGLDHPTTGRVLVEGRDVSTLRGRALADHRRSVGFIFQRFNLIPGLSVLDNVLAPTAGGRSGASARPRALELLERVGLAASVRALPADLSGGEQQRVAIARALVNRPAIVLADEPTGALDTTTGFEVIDLLLDLPASGQATVVIATHDYAIAARAERIVTLRDGQISSDRTLGPPAEPRTTAARIGSLGPMNL